jgi:hypothetical protein
MIAVLVCARKNAVTVLRDICGHECHEARPDLPLTTLRVCCMLSVPSMRHLFTFLAAFLIGIIPSTGITVLVQAEDGLWPAWGRLTAAHPLPTIVREERAADPSRSAEYRSNGRGSLRSPRAISTVTDQIILKIGAEPGFKVVENIVCAPFTRMGNPEESAGLDAVQAGLVPIVPLESVSLPDVAIPVEGIFPDQPGYPLNGEVAVGLQSNDQGLRAWFDSLPAAAPAAVTGLLWIGAVGDVMPARRVDEALLSSDGVHRVFGDTLPVLRSCALLLGNLEAAATTTGARTRKTYTFRFAPAALGALRQAGFSYLSLANNHTFDFGTRGFLDTLANLSQWDLGTSGAGANAREASLPFVAHLGATEVRILSFAAYPVDRTGFDGRRVARATPDRPGTLWLDEEGLAAAARAFSPGSFNIALVHGGEEWSAQPTSGQRRLYAELVRTGADLVIGSHPHVLQGLQAFQGSLIAYSLGNFIFPGMDGTDGGEDSVILKLGLYKGKIRYVVSRPVRIQGASVRMAEGDATRLRLLSLTRKLAAYAIQ